MTLRLGRQTCGSLDEASAREWLVTDGLGGFAMGTVAGLRTRRYHGLLVTATEPPTGRSLGLAALDRVLVIGGRRIQLATHEWAGGAISPRGFELLEGFAIDRGVPRWRWSIGPVTLEAELAMTRGRPAVGVRYRLLSADAATPVGLEVGALCSWRDAHGERTGSGAPSVERAADGFSFEGAYRVRGPGFTPGGEWYRGVFCREEAARGLNPTEDLWFAGSFAASLAAGEAVEIEAWAGTLGAEPPRAGAIVDAARHRAAAVAVTASSFDGVDGVLAHAADQLIVTTDSGPSVVAGYPWFGAWSRDTMTSYEGLFVETGRHEEGRALLIAAGASASEGMLANTADAGSNEYNSVDASLWFVHAIGRHVERTGDADLGIALAGVVRSIIDHHLAGTRFGIRVDDDGLVTQGAAGWALTWMDARVDGVPVTPRHGKPVEVNALWLRALAVASAIATRAGADTTMFDGVAARAARSFASRFPRPDGHGLFDVVDGPSGDDASVRPNQLLAVSLPGPPDAGVAMVLRAVEPLVASLGLLSLSPDDPRFQGRHRGGQADRDRAYHQGTVWPWLVGPYVDATLRAGRADATLLDGLIDHLCEWGLGSVSETADGDPPHAATGCPFQAWSVAELLRARRALADRS